MANLKTLATCHTRLSFVLSSCLLIAACNPPSSDNATGDHDSSTALNSSNWVQPAANRIVQSLTYRSDQELLVNSDFSNQLIGWGSCNNNTAVSVTNNTAEIAGENCVHQSIDVSTDQDLRFSCEVRQLNTGSEWAGLTLSFYSDSWELLAEAIPAQVNGEAYSTYATSGTAPPGARFAGIMVYTVSGVSVTACSLTNVGNVDPPPVDPPPVDPPPDQPELLENADFSNQLSGWGVCNTTTDVSVVNGTAVIGDENCIYQSIEIVPDQEISLSCEARRTNPGPEWTLLNLGFYDASWNLISEPAPTQISSDSFGTYTVAGTAPAGARNAGIMVYTSTGVSVSRCSLTNSNPVAPPEPPQPPPPEPTTNTLFCPAYDESPLYRERENTLVLGPQDDNWERQVQDALPGTEILLMDGEYLMDQETIFMANSDITVRSLSGNRDGVIIRGLGYYTGAGEGFMVAADRITIADMTMHGMRRHAIAMKPGLDDDGILDKTFIYNMNIYDTGTQQVKGADAGENREAVVACSRIGNTPGSVVGDYIGAIGIFQGSDVVVRDNYVYNITGDGSGCDVSSPETPCTYDSVPAIYMRESRDSIVERNTVLDSWRGISLGLSNGHVRGIVRNNYVYRSAPGDHGISIELSTDTIIEHNTVMVEGYWAPIEVRAGSGHIFRNNLTTSPIQLRDGTFNNSVDGNGNIEFATTDDFIAPGDPHLRAGSLAIGGGVVPSDVTYDIDGDTRLGRWDVGADQFTD